VGGRVGAARAARLARDVRTALLKGLATETVAAQLRSFAEEIVASPRGVPRGERPAAKASLREVERRIGISLS
jgi:hypothetical protein